MRLPVLILAAGQSSRMRGADKLLQPVGDVPLIRRIAGIALAAGLDLHVALPGPDHPRAAALAGLPLRLLILPGSAEGMGGTLRQGIAALPPAPRFMVLLADLPELTAADLAAVVAAPGPPGTLVWRGADPDGRPGHPILCADALRPAFASLTGDEGGRRILAPLAGRTVLVPLPPGHATRDLDTPEDWAAWRAGQ